MGGYCVPRYDIKRMYRFKKRRGFTLIELLLVITIISVLAGVSFPFIKNTIQSTRFKSFSNKTYLFLDYAKTQAILRSIVLKVRIDLDNAIMVIIETDDELVESVVYKINIPEKVSIESENEEIFFYPDGTLQPIQITISDDKGRSILVTSKGIDGKIVTGQ